NRTKRCRCPIGQHWNKHSRRCEWPHGSTTYSVHGQMRSLGHDSDRSGSHPALAIPGNGPTSHHPIATNIDLKLFEIVLEFAFLLACLLGYKACSNVCCKDDNADSNEYNTDTYACSGSKDGATSPTGSDDQLSTCDAHAEVKSDEESI